MKSKDCARNVVWSKRMRVNVKCYVLSLEFILWAKNINIVNV